MNEIDELYASRTVPQVPQLQILRTRQKQHERDGQWGDGGTGEPQQGWRAKMTKNKWIASECEQDDAERKNKTI